MILSVQTGIITLFLVFVLLSLPWPHSLFFFLLPLQRAVVVSTSPPPRTFSAPAARRTASTTARAPGAATARTATTEPSLTLRLWPAPVSLPCPLLGKHSADRSPGSEFKQPHMRGGKKTHSRPVQPVCSGLMKAPDVFHSSSSASQYVIIIMFAGSRVCFLS